MHGATVCMEPHIAAVHECEDQAAVAPKVLHHTKIMAASILTFSNVREHDMTYEAHQSAICDAKNDKKTRVKVYTTSGVQIGLAGVGEGDNRLTFPRHYQVKDALQSPHWVRHATAEEIASTPASVMVRWWRLSEVLPTTIVFSDGSVASPTDPIGLIPSLCPTSGERQFIVTALKELEDKECGTPSDSAGGT